MVKEHRTVGSIIKEFPCFETVGGLIEGDFQQLFPENHAQFLQKWPEIQPKVVSCARQLKGNLTAMELLTSYDSDDMNKEGWNPSTCSLLLLLCLLPPTNQGKSVTSSKMSVSAAVPYLIQFQKSGASLQEFLDNSQETQMQPYLLVTGSSKRLLQNFYIIVDHKVLPCNVRSVEGAMDQLFKTHYVFGLEYSKPLHNFYTFLQTAVYGIDVGISRESPRVREMRSRLYKS